MYTYITPTAAAAAVKTFGFSARAAGKISVNLCLHRVSIVYNISLEALYTGNAVIIRVSISIFFAHIFIKL